MLFSLLKHYLDLYITDTALKVSQSLYCFTTSISHGVEEKYFPKLWGTGISDAIFSYILQLLAASIWMLYFVYEMIFIILSLLYDKVLIISGHSYYCIYPEYFFEFISS